MLEATVIGGDEGDNEIDPETAQFDCPSVGNHPAPTCSAFYICSQIGVGGTILQSCGAGLHFDVSIGACNWPLAAKCAHSQTAAAFYTREVCQHLEDGLYSDPADCSQMFSCSDGHLNRMSCPYGQFFNADLGVCTFLNPGSRCSMGSSRHVSVAPSVPHMYGPISTYQYLSLPYHLVPQTYGIWPHRVLPHHVIPKQEHLTSSTTSYHLTGKQSHAYSTYAENKNVVCYFTNWATDRQGDGKYVPENLESSARLCTHIFYAYAKLDPVSLELVSSHKFTDETHQFFDRAVSIAKSANPNVKVLLSIGGWTDSGTDKYSRLVMDKDACQQ